MSSEDQKSSSEPSYFRVACEFQVRARKIDEEELRVFEEVSLRPSPMASIRGEIDTLLRASPLDEGSKSVVDYVVSILLNIDQRLDRIEEDMQNFFRGEKSEIQFYEWVSGEIGGEGCIVEMPEITDANEGDHLIMDLLLPTLPEQRIVAVGQIQQKPEPSKYHLEFKLIHADDKEYLYRFIRSREREILRARKKQKAEENV